MSMPRLSSSPWMRGAPQPGFSRHILRIRSRTSLEMTGRPGFPQRTFQVQNKRKAARCQAMTVSGLTMGPWPTPSANRARGATDRSRAGGRPRSIWGAFLQTCGARRFDGESRVLEPEGSTRPEDRGQRCEECREKNEHRRELCRKTNSHALKHFEIFERHRRKYAKAFAFGAAVSVFFRRNSALGLCSHAHCSYSRWIVFRQRWRSPFIAPYPYLARGNH